MIRLSKNVFTPSSPTFKCLRRHLSSSQLSKDVRFSNGRTMNLSCGKFSKIADGSCVASIGNTNVMVAAVSKSKNSSATFMPLTVDYREKSSAAGRIPTNHLRRELAPSEREILVSRLIDRSIRTSFPPGFYGDTQLSCNLLSVDSIHDPDVISINAASAALALSNIPWDGPVGAVRVALLDNDIVVNPTRREMLHSNFNLVVTTKENKNVVMMEGSCKEPVTLNDLLKLIKRAQKENQIIIREIKKLENSLKVEKRTVDRLYEPSWQQIEDTKLLSQVKVRGILSNHKLNKTERDLMISLVRDETIPKLKETYPEEDHNVLMDAFIKSFKLIHQEYIFETGNRCDGRSVDEIRPLHSEVSLFSPLHGSALFQRGQTQVLATVTFDSPDSALRINNLGLPDEVKEKKFMLHYDFPKYATNEIGKSVGIGRREIGHGALAEKSLRPLVPNDFPFTIRLTAEVFESNGSSSMASVCAGSMALMDAGVQVKEHAAGVAMGLLVRQGEDDTKEERTEEQEAEREESIRNHRILTDISGFEDFYGEMDFKVAGTKKGFTAMQLDCKLKTGLSMTVIQEALVKAHDAKGHILNHMNQTIKKPVAQKLNWPVVEKITVPIHRRGAFVGMNGLNLKKLKAEIGVTVNQDEQDANVFNIFAPNQEAMNEANEFINSILKEEKEPNLEFGAIYTAKIVEIRDNGVMISLYPNMRPVLLHNRELDRRKISHPSALDLKVDQEIQVKYFGRDPSSGEMRISRRVLQMSSPISKNLIQS